MRDTPTDTLNIMDWCRDNHALVPTCEERAGSVVITFLPAVEFETDLCGQITPSHRARYRGRQYRGCTHAPFLQYIALA